MTTYASVFDLAVTQGLIDRVQQLTPDTVPQWGKMNAGQMLAHCNVAYDMETGDLAVNNNFLTRIMLRLFVKNAVVGNKPYPRNGRTAPAFLVTDERDFERERVKLIAHLQRVQSAGSDAYAGKKNVSFGPLTATQWSTLYHKHLDHHLTQFGV